MTARDLQAFLMFSQHPTWFIEPPGGGGGGGELRISSDRDDRRIFLGLKFSIPGFFWVRKFGMYFLG